jgi:ABC-type ATPase with predicted acetyltransferase domain
METDTPWEITREATPRPRLTFLDDIYVEKGSRDDWNLLSALHYKAHGLTPGSHYFRLGLAGETIGVIMMASPKLLVKERHIMFPKLKPKPGTDTKVSNHARMVWVNKNMSIVARCVVDTMYRGAGLAYRFTNIASRMEGKRYIEIQSSMSKYNQFAQKAGFLFVPPTKSTKFDVGMTFLRSTFAAEVSDLEAILEELNSLPHGAREKTLETIRIFYRKNSALESTGKALIRDENGVRFSDKRVARLSDRELIGQLQQMVLACPLYGVYENPDMGRKLPDRIPVTAFDLQKPNEPLRLDA